MRLKLFNGFVILFILERALALEDQLEYDIEAPDQTGKNIFELNVYFRVNLSGG